MKNKLVVISFLLIVGLVGILFVKGIFLGEDGTKKILKNLSFSQIELKADNISVEIYPTKDDFATVEVKKKKKKQNYQLKVNVIGDTLAIHLKEKRWGIINFGSSLPTLIVKVPEKEYESIRVESDNGKISMENLRVKAIGIETDNGMIGMKNVVATTVDVETDNGLIELDHVEGTIRGKTDTGMISLVTTHLDRAIDLKTDVGRLVIKTEKEPTNATIEVQTDIGMVDIFGTNNKRTVFGNGKHLIELKSDIGQIKVTK